jgi:predicted RNase H-like HicB family nuclease
MSKGAQPKIEPKGVYTAWIVLSPAEDLPSKWVAHALDFDVVTHGDSAEHAYRMAAEAVEMVLTDDLRDGVDPYARRAPEDCWKPLLDIFDNGEPINRPEFIERLQHPAEDSVFAVQMVFRMRQAQNKSASRRPPYDAPLAMVSPAPAHAC